MAHFLGVANPNGLSPKSQRPKGGYFPGGSRHDLLLVLYRQNHRKWWRERRSGLVAFFGRCCRTGSLHTVLACLPPLGLTFQVFPCFSHIFSHYINHYKPSFRADFVLTFPGISSTNPRLHHGRPIPPGDSTGQRHGAVLRHFVEHLLLGGDWERHQFLWWFKKHVFFCFSIPFSQEITMNNIVRC